VGPICRPLEAVLFCLLHIPPPCSTYSIFTGGGSKQTMLLYPSHPPRADRNYYQTSLSTMRTLAIPVFSRCSHNAVRKHSLKGFRWVCFHHTVLTLYANGIMFIRLPDRRVLVVGQSSEANYVRVLLYNSAYLL